MPHPKLTVKAVPVDDLIPDPKNARVHPERNVEAIAASLRRFGQQKPIVATREGVVIAGNGTLEAARRLGWATLDVIYTDLDDVASAAYALADNRTAELAEWDEDALRAALTDVNRVAAESDLAGIGSMFDGFEFSKIPEAPDGFGIVGSDLETQFQCPSCGYEWSGNPKPESGLHDTPAEEETDGV